MTNTEVPSTMVHGSQELPSGDLSSHKSYQLSVSAVYMYKPS